MTLPSSPRKRRERANAEKFIARAFSDAILAKAALLVIHRVARSMQTEDFEQFVGYQRQQQALDQLLTFAKAHPLPPDMEERL